MPSGRIGTPPYAYGFKLSVITSGMVETLIIGAGTAGLSCGRVLQDAKRDYLIVDGKDRIGSPYRSTYGISTYYVNKYRMPGHDGDPSPVASYIDSIRMESDERQFDLRFDHHVGIVYDPDKYEPGIARDLNIQMRAMVTGINDGVVMFADGSTMKPRNIVITAGPTSHLIPKHEQYQYPKTEWIAAYEESRVLPKRQDVDLVLHFSDTYAPGGYLWDFPSNNGLRRIGVGVVQQRGRRPAELLHRFDMLREDQVGDVDHTISHVIPVCPPPKRVVFGNIAYAGESARTTFASTGGGLQGAWRSGMLAGTAIAHDGLESYQVAWRREMYPLLMRHYKIKKAIYKMGQSGFNSLLKIVSGYNIRTEDVNRELPKLARYLLIHKPSMIAKLIGVVL